MLEKILSKIEYAIMAGLMLVTTGLLFSNVMLRYPFGTSLVWAEEVLRYCIVWITFIGISTCVKENSHICLDFLPLMLPEKGKRILNFIVNVLVLVSSIIIGYYAFNFVLGIQQSKQVSATIGGFPMYIVYSCIPLGFFLASIRSLQKLIEKFLGSKATSDNGGPSK
jgi:C4-dicarboxylate transporter DctQ subunit